MIAAQPALAAPWARDRGAVFLSYSLNLSTTLDAISAGDPDARLYHSLYGEYGLGRRLTLGFDLGGDDGSAMVNGFVRYTFTRAASPWQVAADLGFGLRDIDGTGRTELYRIGGSVGRGFAPGSLDRIPMIDPDGGWFSVDAQAFIDPEGANSIWQVEATMGVNINDRFSGMVQIKAEEYPGNDLAAYLSPSLLVTFSSATTLQIGGRLGLEGSDELGLRAGLWREF